MGGAQGVVHGEGGIDVIDRVLTGVEIPLVDHAAGLARGELSADRDHDLGARVDVAGGVDETGGGVGRPSENAHAVGGEDEAVAAVELEDAAAGEGDGGSVAEDEEAVAEDGDVGGAAGGLKVALAHDVVDARQLDAEADLYGVGSAFAAGAQGLREGFCEGDAGRFEPHGVDVGDVVCDYIYRALVGLKASHAGEDRNH